MYLVTEIYLLPSFSTVFLNFFFPYSYFFHVVRFDRNNQFTRVFALSLSSPHNVVWDNRETQRATFSTPPPVWTTLLISVAVFASISIVLVFVFEFVTLQRDSTFSRSWNLLSKKMSEFGKVRNTNDSTFSTHFFSVFKIKRKSASSSTTPPECLKLLRGVVILP